MCNQRAVELVTCPQCGQVASIEWSRTGSDVIYLKIRCIARHWFLMAADDVSYYGSDTPYSAATTRQ
jgi:hypothetical protein